MHPWGRRIIYGMLLALVAVVCVLPKDAPAAECVEYSGPVDPVSGMPTLSYTECKKPEEKPTKCSKYVGVSNRIVMCLRDTLESATHKYFTGFYKIIKTAIGAFLTLVVIVYGVLAAFGMLEKPGRDVMILLVKLSFVTYFVVNVDQLYSRLMAGMDAAAAAVVDFTPLDGPVTDDVQANQITCYNNIREASEKRMEGGKPNYAAAWLGVDCMLDSVLGIKMLKDPDVTGGEIKKGLADLAENKKLGDRQGIARGLLGFFFSTMQSSVLGVLMAIIGLAFVYTLVWLIVKALFIYLAGYIGVTFMLIFAPLFIPLVLFRVTSEYFRKWVKLTIGFALQPVITLAYITFTIAAVDLAMFSGDYSVMYRIAGKASRADGFNLNQYIEEHQITVKKPKTLVQIKTGDNIPTLNQDGEKAITALQDSDCMKILRELDLSSAGGSGTTTLDKAKKACLENQPIQWWHNSIDWNKMAASRVPAVDDPGPEMVNGAPENPEKTPEERKGRQISREVLAAILFAAVVVYVMSALLNILPSVVNDLVGDSFQSPSLYGATSRKAGGGAGFLGKVMQKK